MGNDLKRLVFFANVGIELKSGNFSESFPYKRQLKF